MMPLSTTAGLRIIEGSTAQHRHAWDEFVLRHWGASNYHRWGWKHVLENALGWQTWYLMAESEGRLCGVLPLVWQKSFFFGSFVTSLPFLNAGGVLGESDEVGHALVDEAIGITRRLGADYLELRHRHEHRLGLLTKIRKLRVVLSVEADEERMFQRLDKKVRADVRKSTKAGFSAQFGGAELLDDFYRIFVANMRDLGTPVYSPRFFREIFGAFPNDARICCIRLGAKAVAAAFLTGFRDTIEVAWASSIRKHLLLKPNMFLYWNLICFAGKQGYRIFDFGRSSPGSGTHRFKMQWGAQEIPLYWDYWLPKGGDLPELNPQNPKYRMAIWAWQKLPIFLTRWIGPAIVRRLP